MLYVFCCTFYKRIRVYWAWNQEFFLLQMMFTLQPFLWCRHIFSVFMPFEDWKILFVSVRCILEHLFQRKWKFLSICERTWNIICKKVTWTILKGQKYHFQVHRLCRLVCGTEKYSKFAPNLSKNKLLGENAVTQLHESCLLRIMGSAPVITNYSSQNSMRKNDDKMSNKVVYKKSNARGESERERKIEIDSQTWIKLAYVHAPETNELLVSVASFEKLSRLSVVSKLHPEPLLLTFIRAREQALLWGSKRAARLLREVPDEPARHASGNSSRERYRRQRSSGLINYLEQPSNMLVWFSLPRRRSYGFVTKSFLSAN